jgi:serine/threonine protein kinase
MFMTGYDGALMHKSQLGEGDSIAHNISLTYSLGLYIDSSRTKDCELVRQSSLGSKINHDYRSSNVRFERFDWVGPISHFSSSCWVVAKDSGSKHAMLKAYYTGSAAERDHGIPRRIVAEGENLIPPNALQGVQPLVTEAMEVLRKNLGLNLVSICGAGSEGVAVEVSQHDVQETFVVKLTSQPVHALKRGGVLCEAALLYQATRKQGCQGIGIFCPTLEKDIGWGTCPVALLRANGQLIGARAMQHFDVDGSFIRKKLSERFMVGRESQNAEAVLRDMQSVLRGTMQATVWMHASGLAHGDLKDSNMLLKRLKQIPRDTRVAFCVVEGITYQIVFGDWGHARWSGQSDTAIHVFTRGGKEHETTTLLDVHPKESFTLVQARELRKSYGHMLQTPFSFVHPGSGTVSSRCPNHDREFQHGQGAVQRLFDQAADMWALGVFSVRVLAPPFRRPRDNCGQEWAEGLWKASERAEKQLKALKPSSGGKRASEALHALSVPEDRGSWIAAMVRVLYQTDRWPILSGCLSGDCGSQWLSLLDLQQGLLRFTSEDRLKANDALEHMFFGLDL